MDKIKIDTTQNIAIEYEVASVGDRILAVLLDGLIILGYVILINMLGFSVLLITKRPEAAIAYLLFMLPVMLYTLLSETFMNGQTIGKRARRIKVIRLDGGQPRFGDYLLRWLLRLIEVAPYGVIAIITIVLNQKGQRLGDLAAGTAVIKLRKEKKYDHDELFNSADENYVPVFPQAIRLSESDINIIHQALNSVTSQNKSIVLEKLSQKIKSIMEVESSLSDEAFLKTVMKDFNKMNEKN